MTISKGFATVTPTNLHAAGWVMAEITRLASKADATGCTIAASYATGFPRALPPVRKIGLGRRALAGMVPGSKLPEAQIARFESSLERDLFVLLEFNTDVERWDPQPVRIPVGESGQSYTPDVLVSYRPQAGHGQPRRVLYEVKYRDELRAKWSELKPRFKAARSYARQFGWEFKIITEREIRDGGLLWNAKFLLPYIHDELAEDSIVLLHTMLRRAGPWTPKSLLSACSDDVREQARLLAVIWQRVACRRIKTDLTVRLNMNSEIWTDE